MKLEQEKDAWSLVPETGDHVIRCISRALEAAQKYNKPVTIKRFNGSDIEVKPGDTVVEVYTKWTEGAEKQAEDYRNSPAGKQEAAERIAVALEARREVVWLIRALYNHAAARGRLGTDWVVRWVAKFAAAADHRGTATVWAPQEVMILLEGMGYRGNAHVTEDKEAVKGWTRQQLGEYIIGQALSCLKRGLPPHPMCIQFAQEYENKGADGSALNSGEGNR